MSQALKVIGYGFERKNSLFFLCETKELDGIVVLHLNVTINTMVLDHRFFKLVVTHKTFKGDKAKSIFMEYKELLTHVPKEYLYINLLTNEEKGERKYDEQHIGYEYVSLNEFVTFKDGVMSCNEEHFENVGKYDEDYVIVGASENNLNQLEVFVQHVLEGFINKIVYNVDMKTGEMEFVEFQEMVYDEPNLIIENLEPIGLPTDKKFLKYYETIVLNFDEDEEEEPGEQILTLEECNQCEEQCPGLIEEDDEPETEYDDEAGMTDEEVEAYMKELRARLKEQGLVEGVDYIFHEDFRYEEEEEPVKEESVEISKFKKQEIDTDPMKDRLDELEKEITKLKELVEYINDYKLTELEYHIKTLILKYDGDEEEE